MYPPSVTLSLHSCTGGRQAARLHAGVQQTQAKQAISKMRERP